jgi:uncharacterized protein YggU (UPF0235/DUF167 family)
VDGKANAAVIKELAAAFNLRARDFTIVHGELSRDKRVLVRDATGEHFLLYQKWINEQMRLY